MTVLKFNQAPANSFNSIFENLVKDIPSFTENRFNPRVNIFETKEAFLLEVNAPGRLKENFNLKFEKTLLTVSYQVKENNENAEIKSIRKEFSTNGFSRTFTIDEKIVADNISAKYENGILLITLPKKEELKVTPKEITIQ